MRFRWVRSRSDSTASRRKNASSMSALQPVVQSPGFGDAEVLRNLADRGLVFSSNRHDVVAELGWIGSRHCCRLFREVNPHKVQCQPNLQQSRGRDLIQKWQTTGLDPRASVPKGLRILDWYLVTHSLGWARAAGPENGITSPIYLLRSTNEGRTWTRVST